jgi:predicted O-methyltransferase YrrM
MKTWPSWYPRVQADYLSQVFQWFNEDRSLMRLERPMAPRQAQLIRWLSRLAKPLVGAEVGVFGGHTSEVLLRELPELSLWMVDPWRPYRGASEIGDQDATAFERAMASAIWWTEFAGERRFVLRESSPQAADRFADASLDFAFIDGNHLYESVCADLFAWWPKIRAGGLLAGHDFGVHRDATGQWGVRRAVNEFVAATHRELLLGPDGTWCITK